MAGSGRFNFDDGGSFCGGWYAGMAEGYAVCSGPDGQGVFAGSWSRGFEVSGVYKWPNGDIYEGQWKNGKREGAGVQRCGEWVYRGEWARGSKNGYGLRQRRGSLSCYRGAWYDGLYHGYGMETYGDGGTYEGQWQQGRRQGFGVRTSAPYANAVEYRKRSRAKSSTLGYDSARNSILNTNETVNSGSSKRGGFTLNDRKCT
uniref:Uncharacterized protein n=1 Tax=Plectus sambesii TaxID=2011161 RepID=A0A914WK52_9BILA